jgi:SAM-dependent methyltransferase
MHWVKSFYAEQNRQLGSYLSELNSTHTSRAELLTEWSSSTPKHLLELGAGGGQTSIALAEMGNWVTMVELLPESVAHAKRLAVAHGVSEQMQILQADFYKLQLTQRFDLICYFDSFGIGTDADQTKLLNKICKWLAPNGIAIIEIGSTGYWANEPKGRTIDMGACTRHYDFDTVNARLLDTWTYETNPSQSYVQSLRTYTPADFALLLKSTKLKVLDIRPNGKVDFELEEFIPNNVPLEDCMTYFVKLGRK